MNRRTSSFGSILNSSRSRSVALIARNTCSWGNRPLSLGLRCTEKAWLLVAGASPVSHDFRDFVPRRISLVLALLLWFSGPTTMMAQPPERGDAQTANSTKSGDAVQVEPLAQNSKELQPLPPAIRPEIKMTIQPKSGAVTGDLINLRIVADARKGDDITIPEQHFDAFDIHKKDVKIVLSKDGQHKSFIFSIDLLALLPGDHEIPEVTLRVVTADGIVGSVKTGSKKVSISSLLANEPDAKLKGPSKPVAVLQNDFTLLYLLGAFLLIGLVVLLTLLFTRWWRKREKKLPPAPPPRPAWEIAVEKLQQLQREKQRMIEENKGSVFVDRASDIVREYLGNRFTGSDLSVSGLETTSSEMIQILRELRVEANLLQEVTAFLFRCDLIKFAKVVPNPDEVDLIFAEAQEIVRSSTPQEPFDDETPNAIQSSQSKTEGVTSE